MSRKKQEDEFLTIKDVARKLGYSEGGIYNFLTNNKVPREKICGIYFHNYTMAKAIKDNQDEMKKSENLSLKQKRAKTILIHKKNKNTSIKKIMAQTGATEFSVKKWLNEYKDELAEKKPKIERLDPFKLMALCSR